LAPCLLPLAIAAAPALAQEPIRLSAEEAAALDGAMRTKSNCAGQPGEIVVCGRVGGGRRIEFEREPGEIVRHLNEPGRGVDALNADHCTRLCNVGVNVDLIAAAHAVPKIVRHILGRD
jgi:hypothetical protein